jgi:UDP-N-acetylglucosamine--N-acetylmuramyl-(pentapeptide) pyrophosphoryl-undecaprenol N-acetylglucosamine transferase
MKAVTHPFFAEMDLALGAATVAVSRAGASSLAEFAAMRLPSVLIPYPSAADNHQYHNARALADSGAARMLEQRSASAAGLVNEILALLEDGQTREKAQRALAQWHAPDAASVIANEMLGAICRAAGPAPGLKRPANADAPEQQHCTAV